MQYQLDYAIDTMSRPEIQEYLEKSNLDKNLIITLPTESLREVLRKEVERGTIDVSY